MKNNTKHLGVESAIWWYLSQWHPRFYLIHRLAARSWSHRHRLKHDTARKSLSLDGCVIAIDGFGVSTQHPFKSEVIRPKINGFKKVVIVSLHWQVVT